MAAQASFIAADQVPANHTFTRINIDNTSIRYQERTGTSSLAWKNWTFDLRPPIAGNGSKVYKMSTKFTVPTVVDETINGVVVPKKAREVSYELTVSSPADATDAERQAAHAMFVSGLDTATVKDQFVNLLALNGP